MAQPDRELCELLRRSLRATAESMAVGEDGLDKIWTRLAAARQSAAADHGHIAVARKTRAAPVPRERRGIPAP